MVAAAMVGSAVIGAAGSAYAAHQQASGAKAAANTQQNMFNTVQANSQPYMQAGDNASTTLSQLMGLSGTPGSQVGNTGLNNGYLTSAFNPTQQQLESYPGYQFQLQQGGQATRNADTPGIGALSGAALKDLTSFNQGLAASNYSNYFNQDQTQKNNIYNRLSQIAGLGQSAAAGVGNSGTQLGQGIASSQMAGATASAAGTVGATNSVSGGLNNLAGLMYLNGQNGSMQLGNNVSQASLNNANTSSDPIGALASTNGWIDSGGG